MDGKAGCVPNEGGPAFLGGWVLKDAHRAKTAKRFAWSIFIPLQFAALHKTGFATITISLGFDVEREIPILEEERTPDPGVSRVTRGE